jgi:hypothetical protein
LGRFIHHLTRFQAHGESGALEIKMHRLVGQIDVIDKRRGKGRSGEEREGRGGATALAIIIIVGLRD